MTMVTQYNWDDDTFTHHAEHEARQAWREAVTVIAEKARETLPDCAGRVDRAVQIVLNHDVELLEDGQSRVASQSSGEIVYHLVNGECTCKDFVKAPSGWCKHRIAAGLYKRATALVQRQLAQHNGATNGTHSGQVAASPAPDEPAPPAVVAALLPESLLPYVVHIKGKAFIQYGGLLTLAQSRGLVSLKVDFISVTSELALARAEAVFADGRTYTECADATPGNVGAQVRAHFPRLALTRSKARCLRDALGITMVAVEELSADD